MEEERIPAPLHDPAWPCCCCATHSCQGNAISVCLEAADQCGVEFPAVYPGEPGQETNPADFICSPERALLCSLRAAAVDSAYYFPH